VGLIGARLAPEKFAVQGPHSGVTESFGSAVIDDDTPPPAHARFSARRAARYALIGFLLWTVPITALLVIFGWEATLTQMGWFFTKAALLTFGGAYAVLPYVYQGAVEHYQWLSATQMIDGLALGETTPGPLIMVVSFVAFVGAWTSQVFGPDRLFAAGAMAAALVTYFTFLPCFLFILIGGPLVEATRGDLKFTAPLTGITAAVVGVILNLSFFFAYHVLWPEGFGGRFEWFSALIGAAALLALVRFGAGVIPVIAACSAAGLVYTLLVG
ncbi:MAG: chromate transporter, partial [Burkholderiales bacterium]